MERNLRLDSLRGLAASIVVFHHVIHLANGSLVETLLLPETSQLSTQQLFVRLFLSALSGGMAVNIFFVLSGLVLSASLMREPTFDGATVMRFVVRRILRVYPALIVTILAFGAASYLVIPATFSNPFTLSQMLKNCLLLNDSVNGATWTLQMEMLAVPFILLVAWLHRLFGAIAVVISLIVAMTWIFEGPPFGIGHLNVTLLSFGLGMLIPTQMTKDAISKLPKSCWVAFLVLMVAIRFIYSLNDVNALLWTLLLSFGVVAALYHGNSQQSILDKASFRFLGRISYSMYLIHTMVIYELFPLVQRAIGAERISEHYLLFTICFGTIAFAITIALSTLTEKYVERPFIKIGHRMLTKSIFRSGVSLQKA